MAGRTTGAAGPLPVKQPLLHLSLFCKVLLPETLPKYCDVLAARRQCLQLSFISLICHPKHRERGISALQSFCLAGLMLHPKPCCGHPIHTPGTGSCLRPLLAKRAAKKQQVSDLRHLTAPSSPAMLFVINFSTA